ncbi:hypothetical protein BU14_0112s0019 [Porphyra umbilicalis]|uniref:Uncharacterized protein n=1 Tax=Porphyra umbilicalis TaxID=2786 RepID=A0A1X6PC51_PORUM|nr:hypothetical protein BU14_0112s0019 [Porphyra umbilicalis]|eukprot:OSX78320.1 hypothetical protein BU14_0112s0019 [Porphyra umbilicalis]
MSHAVLARATLLLAHQSPPRLAWPGGRGLDKLPRSFASSCATFSPPLHFSSCSVTAWKLSTFPWHRRARALSRGLLSSIPMLASLVRTNIPWQALCVTYLCALVHPSQSRTPRPPSSFLPGERHVALSWGAAPLLALQPLSLCLMTWWWSLCAEH